LSVPARPWTGHHEPTARRVRHAAVDAPSIESALRRSSRLPDRRAPRRSVPLDPSTIQMLNCQRST
jgi:hypothetical protein